MRRDIQKLVETLEREAAGKPPGMISLPQTCSLLAVSQTGALSGAGSVTLVSESRHPGTRPDGTFSEALNAVKKEHPHLTDVQAYDCAKKRYPELFQQLFQSTKPAASAAQPPETPAQKTGIAG